MGSLVVRILSVVGAILFSVTMLGSGIASADPLVGKTYSDASAFIAKYNGKPVIATVIGSWRRTIASSLAGICRRSSIPAEETLGETNGCSP